MLLFADCCRIASRRVAVMRSMKAEALGKLYALTASEIRVVDAIMKVSGVQALATRLGLFSRTSGKRQAFTQT